MKKFVSSRYRVAERGQPTTTIPPTTTITTPPATVTNRARMDYVLDEGQGPSSAMYRTRTPLPHPAGQASTTRYGYEPSRRRVGSPSFSLFNVSPTGSSSTSVSSHSSPPQEAPFLPSSSPHAQRTDPNEIDISGDRYYSFTQGDEEPQETYMEVDEEPFVLPDPPPDQSLLLDRYNQMFEGLEKLRNIFIKYPQFDYLVKKTEHIYNVLERNHRRVVIPISYQEAYAKEQQRITQANKRIKLERLEENARRTMREEAMAAAMAAIAMSSQAQEMTHGNTGTAPPPPPQ